MINTESNAQLRHRYREYARQRIDELEQRSPNRSVVSQSVNEVSHLSLMWQATKIQGVGAIAGAVIGNCFGMRSIGVLTGVGSLVGPVAMTYQASKLYKCPLTNNDLLIGGLSIGLLQSLFGMGFGAGLVFGKEAEEGFSRLALCVGVVGSAILGSGAGEAIVDSIKVLQKRKLAAAVFGLLAGGYGGYQLVKSVYDLGVSYGDTSSLFSALLIGGAITTVTEVSLGFLFNRKEMLSAIYGKLKAFRS